MDGYAFDRLVRSLTTAETRRGLLQFLAAVTLGGALDLLPGNGAGARGNVAGIGGNRRKHKNRVVHKHRANKENRQRKPRKCEPKAKAKTCAGECGQVENNCKKTVNCGACACDATSCLPPEACGGGGQAGVCGCTATTCAAQQAACGTIPDGCGGTLQCGSCTNPSAPICDTSHQCVPCSQNNPCPALGGCCNVLSGTCQPGDSVNACGLDGQICQDCFNFQQICVARQCCFPALCPS